ncbi:MAG: CBS domain-containing protein [Candidatus Dormibacteraeota bacterium]|nr:CBS domain-containing protein [Candidatus Dormibacteraeota bacterium]
MKASYVMSAPAIVLFPDMTIKEAGSILAGHRISGAPVVDRSTRRLVGMLSEGDLLGADHKESGRAVLVAEVMSPEVLSVDDTTDVKIIAARLLEADVHRAPVLHGEEVVGVVSRHDLLKQMCRSDATITVEVANILKEEAAALAHLEVEVKDGIAFVHGDAGAQTRALALELATSVPGVLGAQIREEIVPARSWVQVGG